MEGTLRLITNHEEMGLTWLIFSCTVHPTDNSQIVFSPVIHELRKLRLLDTLRTACYDPEAHEKKQCVLVMREPGSMLI
jgi:hypothetical protein